MKLFLFSYILFSIWKENFCIFWVEKIILYLVKCIIIILQLNEHENQHLKVCFVCISLACTNVKSIVFFWKLVNKNILRLFLCFILLAFLAHLAQGNECELLSSLGVHCPLTFHILIFSSETRQMNWNLVGSIYRRSSLEIAHLVLIH
jgi:hypothetical protein